jgi:hypothetical protein
MSAYFVTFFKKKNIFRGLGIGIALVVLSHHLGPDFLKLRWVTKLANCPLISSRM